MPVATEQLIFDLERFEFIPTTPLHALLRVRGSWAGSPSSVGAPMLLAERDGTLHRFAALDPAASRISADGDDEWRAAYAVPLSLLEDDSSQFMLDSPDGLRITLPAPVEPGVDRRVAPDRRGSQAQAELQVYRTTLGELETQMAESDAQARERIAVLRSRIEEAEARASEAESRATAAEEERAAWAAAVEERVAKLQESLAEAEESRAALEADLAAREKLEADAAKREELEGRVLGLTAERNEALERIRTLEADGEERQRERERVRANMAARIDYLDRRAADVERRADRMAEAATRDLLEAARTQQAAPLF